MAKLILRQVVINDLTDICEYTIDTWSENQAEKYYESIKLARIPISQNTKIGKEYIQLFGICNPKVSYPHINSPQLIIVLQSQI